MTSVREQFYGFSALNVSADSVAMPLGRLLQKYGPLKRAEFNSFEESVRYLVPIKSFPTRYIILGLDGWSFLLTDSRGENCNVEAYAVSRATKCNAMGVNLRDEQREIQVYEAGMAIREVQSLFDLDRWYYREAGPVQWFEDPDDGHRRRKSDRLKVDIIQRYFKKYTGLDIPNWNEAKFIRIIGLERSVRELQVPLVEFPTELDF